VERKTPGILLTHACGLAAGLVLEVHLWDPSFGEVERLRPLFPEAHLPIVQKAQHAAPSALGCVPSRY
jgi:hypothetical protein